MSRLPFYVVTLTHPSWDEALAYARRLPAEALPELRLDLFPDQDPAGLVEALHRRCLVSCRRASEGGRWPDEDEAGRLEHLLAAVQARPLWVDLEWDLPIPEVVLSHRTHVNLLRSVHVGPGVFDLPRRLEDLPPGEAYKWVGQAQRLVDNARLKPYLAWARDHCVALSAFWSGPKGIPSRALQGAWGGAFTYAAPEGAPLAAPGQLPYEHLWAWRCHRWGPHVGLCGVLGHPVHHSRGPAFHNPRFQRAFKDLVYLPLEASEASEVLEALEALEVLGASLTMPLKRTVPAALGLEAPLNTLWRRHPKTPWQGLNTDALALRKVLEGLPKGPVLVLGDGGVAQTSREVLEQLRWPVQIVSRRCPLDPSSIATLAPRGVIQATALGMEPDDPCPFPEALEAARPSLQWAVEWVYKETTAFAAWARNEGLRLIEGIELFTYQAEAQSQCFIQNCG